jgi:hypothetical protein
MGIPCLYLIQATHVVTRNDSASRQKLFQGAQKFPPNHHDIYRTSQPSTSLKDMNSAQVEEPILEKRKAKIRDIRCIPQ